MNVLVYGGAIIFMLSWKPMIQGGNINYACLGVNTEENVSCHRNWKYKCENDSVLST